MLKYGSYNSDIIYYTEIFFDALQFILKWNIPSSGNKNSLAYCEENTHYCNCMELLGNTTRLINNLGGFPDLELFIKYTKD